MPIRCLNTSTSLIIPLLALWRLRLARYFLGCSLYIIPHRDQSGKADLVMQTSDALWEELRVAGEAEYDRFWRLPLDEDYGPQIHSSNADLCNVNLAVLIVIFRS